MGATPILFSPCRDAAPDVEDWRVEGNQAIESNDPVASN
jgi:hypothetical protein